MRDLLKFKVQVLGSPKICKLTINSSMVNNFSRMISVEKQTNDYWENIVQSRRLWITSGGAWWWWCIGIGCTICTLYLGIGYPIGSNSSVSGQAAPGKHHGIHSGRNLLAAPDQPTSPISWLLSGNLNKTLSLSGFCKKHCQRHYGPRRWLL